MVQKSIKMSKLNLLQCCKIADHYNKLSVINQLFTYISSLSFLSLDVVLSCYIHILFILR